MNRNCLQKITSKMSNILVDHFKLKINAFVNSDSSISHYPGLMFPHCSQSSDSCSFSSLTIYLLSHSLCTSIIWTLSTTHVDIHSLFQAWTAVWCLTGQGGWETVLALSLHPCVYGYKYIICRAFCTGKVMEILSCTAVVCSEPPV